MRNQRTGFTVVELLVVITIIVVLLALLAPAMDKAIYQAELTVCGSRLHSVALGSGQYALNHQRSYPDRTGLAQSNWAYPNLIAGTDRRYDMRKMTTPYIPLVAMSCPLSPKVSLNPADTKETAELGPSVLPSYALWFGYKYDKYAGMKRLGDPLVWSNDNGGKFTYFRVLAADWEYLSSSAGGYDAHPDPDGIMAPQWAQATAWVGNKNVPEILTYTRWVNKTVIRKTVDRNFVLADGSVVRYTDVKPDDARLTPVGVLTSSTSATLAAGQDQLPE